MATIIIAADKGAPGATTTALVLASVWPQPCIVLEADPSGGDLGLRMTDAAGHPQLRPTPSFLTLATDSRGGPAEVATHAQTTNGGVRVIPGLGNAEQAGGVSQMWGGVAASVRGSAVDVLVDAGRLSPQTPALTLVAIAQRLVLVVRPTVDGTVYVRDRIAALHAHPAAAHLASIDVVVVTGDRAGAKACHDLQTVLDHGGLSASVLGYIALDTKALKHLYQGTLPPRSMLSRTAKTIAQQLQANAVQSPTSVS